MLRSLASLCVCLHVSLCDVCVCVCVLYYTNASCAKTAEPIMSRLGVASVEPNEPCIKRRPHPPWEGHFLEDACWPIMKFSNYAELWTCGVVVWIRLHSTTPTVSLRGCRRVRRVGEDVSVGVVECGHSALYSFALGATQSVHAVYESLSQREGWRCGLFPTYFEL